VDFTIERGYARLSRTWQPDDVVELTLPMPIQRVVSHANVTENKGKVAIERGPLVYCAEAVDNGAVLTAQLADNASLTSAHDPDLLQGVTVVRATQPSGELTLIPYYAWAHRGIGEMTVWFHR
jgi:DUF1680 family protein